jgi:siroheme synthase
MVEERFAVSRLRAKEITQILAHKAKPGPSGKVARLKGKRPL